MIATYSAENTLDLAVRNVPCGEIVRTLKPGAVEVVEVVDNGWCKLSDGWCSALFVTVTDEFCDEEAEMCGTPAEETPSETPCDGYPAELEGKTVAELREMAEMCGIDLKNDMKKADIIAAILND